MFRIDRSVQKERRLVFCQWLVEGGKRAVTIGEYRFSLWSDENILKFDSGDSYLNILKTTELYTSKG